jgi:hypothetical protein
MHGAPHEARDKLAILEGWQDFLRLFHPHRIDAELENAREAAEAEQAAEDRMILAALRLIAQTGVNNLFRD